MKLTPAERRALTFLAERAYEGAAEGHTRVLPGPTVLNLREKGLVRIETFPCEQSVKVSRRREYGGSYWKTRHTHGTIVHITEAGREAVKGGTP